MSERPHCRHGRRRYEYHGQALAAAADEEDEIDDSWPHSRVPITEKEREDAALLSCTTLSDSSRKTYSTFIAKFVVYVAKRMPEYLTEDLKEKLTAIPEDDKEWKRFAKKYYLTKPKPPSSMFDLPRIITIFTHWISWMQENDDMSPSAFSTCRSAVVSLFTLFRVPSAAFDLEAASVLRGVKVKHAEAAARGEVSVKRGKDPLSFENYCNIAESMLKSDKHDAIFSHAVMTTMWNLMSRVGNAVSICKSHLQWDEDALLIFFAHEKTDQTQSKPGDPRHIYANPYQPEICPILSLGLFFLLVDVSSSDTEFIFSGSSQYCRFHKSLQRRFADEELLGHSVGTFGTHSIRKGSATYASSGSTHCPSHTAIANRAGWAMGISTIYLQYQAAGDQFVGRTVCGLNLNDESFAVLPPRFKPGYDAVVNQILHDSFTNFDGISAELKKVLTMTTASVVYHMNTLLEKYLTRPGHPLLSLPLFSKDYGVRLSDIVELHTWTPGDAVKATGIPPHICLLLHSKRVDDTLRALPHDLSQMIVNSLKRQGLFSRNMTAEQFKSFVAETIQNALDKCEPIASLKNKQQHECGQVNPPACAYPELYTSDDGKLSRLPPDFVLPRGSLQSAWIRYFCWDTRKRTPPLRAVFGKEMARRLSSRFARYKKLMEAIIRQAKIQNVWTADPKDETSAAQILRQVDLSRIVPSKTHTSRVRRLDQLSWSTLANDYYSARKNYQQRDHQEQLHDDMTDEDDDMTDDE